ncbi:MAG: DUF86 domain-containing protein [Geitlerinemataceae cyanobacterium]
MARDKESLLDIVEAIEKILAYTKGIRFEEFQIDDEKQDAVLRRILVIGEATKRLSAEFKTRHSQIPWKDIAGMRDIVVHDYNRIDLETIWDVVQNDLPELIQFLNSLQE